VSSSRVENGVETQTTGQKVQRLFFALWPGETERKHLQQCQQLKSFTDSLQGHPGSRAVFPGNFHITLAFLGNVNADQRACVEQTANGLQCSPFKLTIDTADYWHKPRILWVGPSEVPDALVTLATELRDGAIECGVQMDMRPYNAHVTLMRKIARLPEGLAIHPFTWVAKHFVLIESTTRPEGVRYEVINQWPLTSSGE
jgi:2'-5' RNA ligase